MSVLPFQVPTRVFIFSNSGEPCFAFGSSAFKETAVATSKTAQTEVICVFMVSVVFLVNIFRVSFIKRMSLPVRDNEFELSCAGKWPPRQYPRNHRSAGFILLH